MYKIDIYNQLHILYITYQKVYNIIVCWSSLYMTYITTTTHTTKETPHDTLDDSTWILHQDTGLMSKIVHAHRWLDESKSQGAAEGPGRSKSVKKNN